jgi:hypothetical protein
VPTFRRTKLYEYLLEVCSPFRRIQLLRYAPRLPVPFQRLLVDAGSDWVEYLSGHLVPCTSTHDRILDTQKFSSNHQWSTQIDRAVFLLGRDAGARWGANNLCTQDMEVKAESNNTSRCSQPSNLSVSQISSGTPAAIAGVARKVG